MNENGYNKDIQLSEVAMMDAVMEDDTVRYRRGPEKRARRKALISMTAAEYEEFGAWAEADGITKAMLMHDMMGRERAWRAGLGRGGQYGQG